MAYSNLIEKYGQILLDVQQPLKKRFRALFALKGLGGLSAITYIGKCFDDSSALLKHELAYCLGQMNDKRAIDILNKVLSDVNQEPMVRHEAGEALGAIGDKCCISILHNYCNDPSPEVSQTCQLALERITWFSNKDNQTDDEKRSLYSTIDPAPPAAETDNVCKLKNILIDTTASLWERYRAMFKLRDMNTDDSILALTEGLKCEDSALFRHEIAFVLGQLQSPLTVEHLIERLSMPAESGMVRHECAEALGAVGTERCKRILNEYLNDPEIVVKESCIVALDICDYNEGDEFQYAAIPTDQSSTNTSKCFLNTGEEQVSAVTTISS